MDLELLEALALADDRSPGLAQLVPGSQDHDYYRGLALQHGGHLDEVDALLADWLARRGATEQYQQLRRRQQLLRLAEGAPSDETVEELRAAAGASLWHEADRAAQDQRHPTRLDQAVIAVEALLGDALTRAAGTSMVSDDAVEGLLDRSLAVATRREVLSRLRTSRHPRLIAAMAEELAERNSRGFGALAIHHGLTLDQLHALAEHLPALRQLRAWIDAVILRLHPSALVDWRTDAVERAAYLDRLWAFVSTLPPAANVLRAHVLYHRLDHDRRLGIHDRDRFLAYLALPRRVSYARATWLRAVPNDQIAPLGQGVPTGFDVVHGDEALVRDYLQHFLTGDDGADFADYLEAGWLAEQLAIARLVAGAGDPERWVAILGPTAVAALRERVVIELCLHNPTRHAADAAVALDVDVKNVSALTVKVYRLNTLAWFLASGRDVDTSIDLDGLAAGHEETLRFDEPPIRRVRRRIELPACARPGTYVVELIGNGTSSRALIRKGGLRHVARIGAAGPVLSVCDEAGHALPDATVWLGDRAYRPRDDGGIVVPFSTRPGETPILLVHGDLAVRTVLDHPAERYQFSAAVHLERESLIAGRTARALVRAALTVAGTAVPIALVEEPRAIITLTDLTGTPSRREQAIALHDDAETVLEVPVPEHVATVEIRIRGRLRVVSEQRTIDVEDGVGGEVAGIHRLELTESLHLAETAGGWVVSLLGKSGEPRPGRALALTLRHRAVTYDVHATVETDGRGRAELGALDGVTAITVTTPAGAWQSWPLLEPAPALPATVHVRGGDTVTLPAPAHARPSLVELRREVPSRDVSEHLRVEAGAVVIGGLAPGRYGLTVAPSLPPITLRIVDTAAPVVAGWAIIDSGDLQLSPPLPVLRDVAADGEHLVVRVTGASATTRVHVVATRFVPSPLTTGGLGRPPETPLHRWRGVVENAYVSGREIGEEYRYVLERRHAPRRAGTLLERPGLLLNPWSLRTTSTAVATAAAGTAYAAKGAAPAPKPTAYAPRYEASAAEGATLSGIDFLAEPAAVVSNLRPDARGLVRVRLAELGTATSIRVLCVDPAMTTSARRALPEPALAPRDLRLRLALEHDGHFVQDKRVTGLAAGAALRVADLATARVEVVDTVGKAHGYLSTLSANPDAVVFGFVTTWPTLPLSEKRTMYSEHACHELHLFLRHKDPAFFAEVVRPYLAHKRHKTFVDCWLLDEDLASFREPWAFGRLNAFERVLLARRLPALRDGVARLLGDAVDLVPRDPEHDAMLIDTMLAGGALDADDALGIAGATRDAVARAEDSAVMAMELAAAPPERARKRSAEHPTALMAAVTAPGGPPAMPPMQSMASPPGFAPPAPMAGGFGGGTLVGGGAAADLVSREEQAPLYRGADRTQEWAETDWWKRHADAADASLITPNRFWRDLARHDIGPFLSPHLGDCAGSFAELMCALAVIDLPFTAGAHRVETADGGMTFNAASACLVAHRQITRVEAPPARAPILVGQSYFRADDRWEWEGAEQREKYATGELIVGVIYACRVIVTNPTAAHQKLDVLIQIPRGAVAVAGNIPTRTLHAEVAPYGTWSVEHAFYFPAAGRFSHFPAHVTRAGELLAWAEPRLLDVVSEPSRVDTSSWRHVAQHGSLDDVIAFLAQANLGRVELALAAWRLRDRTAFDRITAALDARLAYDDTVWSYALVHGDRARLAEWLRHHDDVVRVAGPVLERGLVLEPVARGWYQHLEYAPLVNARAHRLGGKARILNDGLDGQYRAFLDGVAHRARPRADDLLAAAHYLFAQGRDGDAIAILGRVDPGLLATRLQYDYLAAYAATLDGELARARALATPWLDHPVDRWRHRIAALVAMLDEVEAERPAASTDPDSRDQRMTELAARAPALDVAVDGGDIVVDSQHLAGCQLRFHRMDIELLFSRQPFVQGDTRRFSFIEPSLVIDVALTAPRTRVAIPDALRGGNLVVEAVAAGLHRSVAHYANDLAVQLTAGYGQLRVTRASTRAPLAATYVKVYARHRDGAVQFYKDGYTDLRGRFDYATLSTDDLDRVERFALLLLSDQAGATVTEAEPPPR